MAQQPPQQPMPRDYEDMEFTIEGEDWNRYELKDGTTIRGRVILQKVIRDPYKPNNFSFKISPASNLSTNLLISVTLTFIFNF